jgi:hypothetical protein
MPVGLSTVNIANKNLDWLRGVSPGTIAGLYIKLHTGDPGAAGTTAASAVTTRQAATMNAASGGSITLSAMGGSYAMTATETISNFSVWDASTAGNFLFSGAWTASRAVINGDTIVVSTFVVSNTPLAA